MEAYRRGWGRPIFRKGKSEIEISNIDHGPGGAAWSVLVGNVQGRYLKNIFQGARTRWHAQFKCAPGSTPGAHGQHTGFFTTRRNWGFPMRLTFFWGEKSLYCRTGQRARWTYKSVGNELNKILLFYCGTLFAN